MSGQRVDEGFTLIELVIASALGVLVLIVLGSFFISSFSAQMTVTGTAEAASNAQLVARQLDNDLRAASAVTVIDGATSDSQLLIARTSRGTGSDYSCQAWLYDADDAAILHSEFADDTAAPWASNPVSWVDAPSASGWDVIATDIQPQGAADGTPASGIFANVGDRGASVAFESPAGADRVPVLISTTATGRQAYSNTEPACF